MTAKILVIDDEEAIRFTFERFLTAEGYSVATAGSCSEALERMGETNFDVVFADIILGDGTGLDILREIKARGLSCVVIMITGDPGVETAADSIHLGAFDYIPKPVNQESLLHVTLTALKYKAVHDEKERYRTNLEAIFRSVTDAIITVDKESVVIELNDSAMKMCGYSRDDVGKSFSSLPAVCGAKLAEILDGAIKSGGPVEADRIECRPPTGVGRVFSVRTYPLLGLAGMLSGAVMVLRDDSHVVDLERELKEQLKRSSQELEHFAFSASHDMQEPIRKIQTFGSRIKQESLDDQSRDSLQRMVNAAAQMSKMVSGLLNYSQVNTRGEPFAPVNLTRLVKEVADSMGHLVKVADATFEIGDLPTLDADTDQLRRLFQHLIENALKFCTEKNPLIKIFARSVEDLDRSGLRGDKQYFDIFVEDNGIGFDERYLDRIFTLFQRLHGRSAYEGTGMGLPVCRRIVERHRGSITAKSAPGQGTTFIITLPSKQTDWT